MWALRIRKIHALEAVGLTEDERRRAVQNADVAEESGESGAGSGPKPGLSLAFAARACFSVTKV